MTLLELFGTFFYIGLFTIGGGVVAITLMQQTIVSKGIISLDQFYNMVAISESTPGPLGTNMATYIGYKLYGVPGALVTTIGEALPSIIIILIIARFLQKFNQNIYVKGALNFLRPITTGLILVPVLQVFIFALMNIPQTWAELFTKEGFTNLFKWPSLIAYSIFAFLLIKFKLHPIIIILLGAGFGILFL